MTGAQPVDLEHFVFDIDRDLNVTTREQVPGPPARIDGMTLGIATLQPGQSPHDGEMHPDGDEILLVLTGRARVLCDSSPEPLTLSPGQACRVPKGEWHQIECQEETQLLYLSPGPNGEARVKRD